MTSPRDEIDAWLADQVTPLEPPPGTLDRIRTRARNRKRRQALVLVAGCAVVVAGAFTLPRLTASGPQAGQGNPALAHSRSIPAIGPAGTSTGAGHAYGHGTQLHQHTRLTTGTSGTVPPGNFRPTSVTFVGAGTAANPKLVGAVIGQAGPPCYNPGYCTSMAGTASYGASWYGVSAPVATGPLGASGVSQLRFSTLRDGWAFGPALYQTTDGGWPWVQENTYGQRVTGLEAVGQDALAIFATCAGSGPDYASDCTSFTLFQSTARSHTWTTVAVPAQFRHMTASRPSSASLVISGGTTGYLLTPSGAVLTGPVSGGTWANAGQAPCRPGAAQLSGAPASAQLAAGPTELMLACQAGRGGGAGPVTLYVSADGSRWTRSGLVPHAGTATGLASAAAGHAVLATTTGIYYTADGGRSWTGAGFGGPVPAGGLSYVGMTNASQGVAVPARPGLGEIFVTSDGGQTWTATKISGR